jgi:hypothetical protein
MALPSTLNDRQYQSWVELGSSGVPARRTVLYDASGNPLLTGASGALKVAEVRSSDGLEGTWSSTGSAFTPVNAPIKLAVPALYNGSQHEAARANVEGTLLASATRTADTATADQTNHNGRGVILFLNVTAASGTGGVRAIVQGKDPVSGTYTPSFGATPTFRTATGVYVYVYYPGAAGVGGLDQTSQTVLPRTWRALVQHGDASNYTYSLGFSAIV